MRKKRTNNNAYDGLLFHTKKDLDYYLHLKELQQANFISHFALGEFLDEASNEIRLRTRSIQIDDKIFEAKVDADYYLYLKDCRNKGYISSFSLDLIKSDKKDKYNAKKVIIDNHRFDSKDEANFYLHLLEKKRNNLIKGFDMQVAYELQPAFKKNGKTIRKIEYIPDFEVYHLDGSTEVIDVKGMITSDFTLKAKMFDYKFPEKELTLMKYVEKYGGWISIEEWKKGKKQSKKTTKNVASKSY